MFILNDRIKEKTYSVGSGNLDFSGPTPAYSAFSSVYSSGDKFFYCITNDVDYEIGLGKYSPNKLERTQVFKSSKPANAIVNWPVGLKEVYVTYPANNSVYQVNNIDSQNAPSAKNFTYWYGANSISDIEGLSFDSGRVNSALEFSFSNVISFSGYSSTQNSPFKRDELVTSTLIDEVIYQSGEVNQHKGFKKQRAGTVFAGPLDNCGSGSCPSGYPMFRPLSEEDIPVIDSEKISYTPANALNWGTVPTNVEEALDFLIVEASGSSIGSHSHNLSDLNQSSATLNQVVSWNGSVWEPRTISFSGLTWTIVTADGTMSPSNGYIANKNTLLNMSLPTTCAAGTVIRLCGMNSGLWKISQSASQSIKFGNRSTTVGTAGFLSSVLQYDSVELLCIVSNTTWMVISSVGNIMVE